MESWSKEVRAAAGDVIQVQEGAGKKHSNLTVRPIRKPENKAQEFQSKKGEHGASNQARTEKGLQEGGGEDKAPWMSHFIYLFF